MLFLRLLFIFVVIFSFTTINVFAQKRRAKTKTSHTKVDVSKLHVSVLGNFQYSLIGVTTLSKAYTEIFPYTGGVSLQSDVNIQAIVMKAPKKSYNIGIPLLRFLIASNFYQSSLAINTRVDFEVGSVWSIPLGNPKYGFFTTGILLGTNVNTIVLIKELYSNLSSSFSSNFQIGYEYYYKEFSFILQTGVRVLVGLHGGVLEYTASLGTGVRLDI